MKNDKLPLSSRNRRGVLIVILLSCIIMFIPRLMMVFSEDLNHQISSEEIVEFQRKYNDLKSRKYVNRSKKNAKYKRPPSKFNPNTYSREKWLALGLSQKQVDVIQRFTDRGIYSNDELSKIFVIPKELLRLIQDSTVYPVRKMVKSNDSRFTAKRTSQSKEFLEINTASQKDLENLPGIGPFYARHIIAYRSKLGGFTNKKQLLEVWKMREEVYNLLVEKIELNTSSIRKINLNHATIEELKDHPYLNWNEANSIVKMRQQKGKFRNIDEILSSDLIDQELYNKIKMYLTL